MRLPGEEESGGGMGSSVIYMLLGVAAFAIVVIVLVMQSNNRSSGGSEYLKKVQEEKAKQEAEQIAQEEQEEPERKLRAEDLDFWDMYPVEDEEQDTAKQTTMADDGQEQDESTPKSSYEEKAEKDRQEQAEKEEQKDPAADGKHTMVVGRDGTEEWIAISPYLKKNTYDFTKLEDKSGLKRYVEGGKITSYLGVDLSKYSGDVNFDSMKAAGVSYVMLRVGSRGYSSGKITLDENFGKYMQGAIDAGLQIGVYFSSQAITQDEANQEADFVIQNLAAYQNNITYPVAFDMEFAPNDEARIDGLSASERTIITATFLEKIKAAGYTPVIYGDKEWLLKEIDLTSLQDFGVWLSQKGDIPDYPYQFSMWQYTTDGVLNGVPQGADLNLSFVNYLER